MKVTKVKYSECCQILNIQAIRVIFFLNCKIFKVLFKSNTKSALIDVEHGFPMSRSPQGHLKVKGQICQKSLTGHCQEFLPFAAKVPCFVPRLEVC